MFGVDKNMVDDEKDIVDLDYVKTKKEVKKGDVKEIEYTLNITWIKKNWLLVLVIIVLLAAIIIIFVFYQRDISACDTHYQAIINNMTYRVQ